MKSLKITLLIAVFCLTFSGVSSDKEVKPTFDTEQVNSYKEMMKSSSDIAEIKRVGKKPGQGVL